MNIAHLALPVALVVLPGPQDAVDVPTAEHAVPDTPVPDQFRPVLDIRCDGRIFHDDQLLYDPEVDDGRDDPFGLLRSTLAVTAKRMKLGFIDEEAGAGPRIPDEPILLRPDRSAPFRYVQMCMAACGHEDVSIWKVQLAARTSNGAAGRIAAYLPKDLGTIDAAPIEKAEIRIRVLEPGTRLEPAVPGEPRKVATADSGRFVYGDDRKLDYAVGPFKTTDLDKLGKRLAELREALAKADERGVPVTIDARAGTVYQDVTEVLDVVLGAGFVDLTFVGAYDARGR